MPCQPASKDGLIESFVNISWKKLYKLFLAVAPDKSGLAHLERHLVLMSAHVGSFLMVTKLVQRNEKRGLRPHFRARSDGEEGVVKKRSDSVHPFKLRAGPASKFVQNTKINFFGPEMRKIFLPKMNKE